MLADRALMEAFLGFAEPLRPAATLHRTCVAAARARVAGLSPSPSEHSLAEVLRLLESLEADGQTGAFTRMDLQRADRAGSGPNGDAGPASAGWAGLSVRGDMETRLDHLEDQGLLEAVLNLVVPAADATIFSMALVAEFGTLDAVLCASDARIMMISGADHRLTDLLALLRAMRTRSFLEQARAARPVRSAEQVFDYAIAAMAHLRRSEIRVLFLNKHRELIGVEVHQRGDMDHVAFYPREVIARCLDLGARYFIVLQNHLDGETEPEMGDLNRICQLEAAAAGLGIDLIDYVLVTPYLCVSLREQGLIGADKPRFLWFKDGRGSTDWPDTWPETWREIWSELTANREPDL
ncbi:JAB domain-containing protein [Roseibium sp. MB-4]